MTKIPVASGLKCAHALQQIGFYLKRQTGSHMILRRDSPFAQVVVPDHKELDRGTLRAILRHAGVDVEEFVNLLKWTLLEKGVILMLKVAFNPLADG